MGYKNVVHLFGKMDENCLRNVTSIKSKIKTNTIKNIQDDRIFVFH